MNIFHISNDNKNMIFMSVIILQYIFIIFLFFPSFMKLEESDLIKSIKNNDIDNFNKLINNKSWIDKKINLSIDTYGKTPLGIAINKRNFYFVKKLIDYGADPNGLPGYKLPLIQYAVSSLIYARNNPEPLDIIRLLIVSGADVNARSSSGETALHTASFFELYDAGKILIENGADVNVVDDNGSTPLHLAIYAKEIDEAYYNYIKMLIDNGANPYYCYCKYKNHKNPIEIAIDKNDYRLIDILKKGRDTGEPKHYTDKRKYISNKSEYIYSRLYDCGIYLNIEIIDFLYKKRGYILFIPIIFSIFMSFLSNNRIVRIITIFQILVLLISVFIIFPVLLFIALSSRS